MAVPSTLHLMSKDAALPKSPVMNRSIPQDLVSLVPAFNGPFPPSLVDLATSLLAQSRSRASNLKGDEEIARSYACAHLACERLKQSFDLPPIQPKPPCPPRTYQKLYNYLEDALPAGNRAFAPARKPGRPKGTPNKSPVKANATQGRSFAEPIPSSSSSLPKTTKPSARRLGPPAPQSTSSSFPAWLVPATHHLCATLSSPPHTADHILAATESILNAPSSSSPTASPSKNDRLPALLIALYFLVTRRRTGEELTKTEYRRQKNAAVHAIREKTEGNIETEKEILEGKDVDHWLGTIKRGSWEEHGLFDGVIREENDDEKMSDESESDDSGSEDYDVPTSSKDVDGRMILRPGLGTMANADITQMQDKVDYLSEQRRQEYQRWKKKTMRRIENMRRERGMDVSQG
ncbi:MAG: hypothetical protein M1833_000892 [Piccolia ochrophora]|nr:MAG: hypothetical protein M1833_000892 [Piccolia ochrophora]